MTDNAGSLLPRFLQAIRDEQALTNRKLAALAEGMVTLRREVQTNNADVHALAIAFDSHDERLGALDGRLSSVEARLAAIEQRLDRPQ